MRSVVRIRRCLPRLACCAALLFALTSSSAQIGYIAFDDTPNDAVPRVMDPGADTPFDPQAHRLIDLRQLKAGAWTPNDPQTDLFAGSFTVGGPFLRLELVLNHLVNPPGNVDPLAFDPFRYGDHPVYGFVEIDMDNDIWTGGELDAPHYRYLGNIARFGGRVLRAAFGNRMATREADFDGNFLTPPFVERHGEEFHLALFGWQFGYGDIEEVTGDGDGMFEEGETWDIIGPFFHRAHGFEMFSFVEGGGVPGEYAPDSHLRFRHDPAGDVTILSLVFPMTNVGAGLMHGEPPEPSNQDPTDHASVQEALDDLADSASFVIAYPTGLPEEDIIVDWAERISADHLDPADWSITVLLGTSHTQPDPSGVYFVWTDAYPDVVSGDVNGNGAWTERDAQLIAQYITHHDAHDGVQDGVVTIEEFASDFSMYDVNYDGLVSDLDVSRIFRDGDSDRDGDVDLMDVAGFQTCFSRGGSGGMPCAPLDLVVDNRVDCEDVGAFIDALTGPANGPR